MPQPQEMKLGEYLTVSEAAAFLGVSPWTLRNWDKSGKLRPVRHPKNGYRIYRHEDLATVLQLGPANGHASINDIDWSSTTDDQRHIVQFYEDDSAFVNAVAEFVAAGLARNEAAAIAVTQPHRYAIESALTRRGIDTSAESSASRLFFSDAAETLQRFVNPDGTLDPDRFATSANNLISHLSDHGRRRFRACGEMAALLWSAGHHQTALRFEQLWDSLSLAHQFAILCAYPLSGFDHPDFEPHFTGVCNHHTHVIPAESYANLPTQSQRLREIARLQQKARAFDTHLARPQTPATRSEQK